MAARLPRMTKIILIILIIQESLLSCTQGLSLSIPELSREGFICRKLYVRMISRCLLIVGAGAPTFVRWVSLVDNAACRRWERLLNLGGRALAEATVAQLDVRQGIAGSGHQGGHIGGI